MDLFVKIIHWYGPSTIFVKNTTSDVPLSLNTTKQVSKFYFAINKRITKLLLLNVKLLIKNKIITKQTG